ncbi:Hypothetical predicted protein [Olea europaea subsp. europaea]|uniref:Uncharacterized protein n=1 Tax=Olea europaea subsp. europaea TaxID=158383 RepID=A0A8S0TDS6_OLEEU|nr:Hypothetical predicted protein [Olea europaea subsp. europaea]
MSFPDPAQQPPLPPLLPLPFASEDVDRFWPTPPMNGAVSQFEDPPGFKRPMNYENNPSNFAPFAQIKFCDEINKSWTLKGRAIYFTRLVFVQNSPKVPVRMASIAHVLMMLKNYEIPLQIGKSWFEERREAPAILVMTKE